jgi:hypothetical protein
VPHEVVFGSYRSIASALAEELRPRLRAGERCEIIVPTRSASEALLERLGDVLPTIHLEVHSLETLALRVVNAAGHFPRPAADSERELAMELACRSVDADLASTPGITSMLLRAERDVRDSGIPLADLRHRIGSAARLSVRDRLRRIERIWSASARLLRDSGASMTADVLESAIALVRSGAELPRQIVFGFYDVTGLQQMFLDSLDEADRVEAVYVPVRLAPDGEVPAPFVFARPFVEWSRNRASKETSLDGDDETPDWTIMSQPSPIREMQEVCRAVRTLLDGGSAPGEIAIVARAIDPAEASLFATFARRFGFGLRGLPGRPLSGSRIARGVIDLLRLQERNFLRRDVMEILRAGARIPDIESLPPLDRLESATRKARIARGRRDTILTAEKRSRYDENEPDETLLHYADIVDSLDRLTKGFGTARTGTSWASGLESLVGMFRAETDADLDTLDALRDLARSLRRPGFATRRFDARTVVRLIEDAGTLPAPAPVEPAVWFGDVMRFRGLDVKHLFAVRMQHDAMPQRRVEDALLPDVDRRVLGIRQIGDGREEETLLFSILTTAPTAAIHFSFSSSDSLGRSLRPSSLIKDFIIARRPDERLSVLQDFTAWLATAPAPPSEARSVREAESSRRLAEADPALVRSLQLVAMKGSGSPFDGMVAPGDALTKRLETVLRRVSPSRLEQLGECPQRFFMSSVLGLREVEEPEPNVQIEIREKGLIDHEILEELYGSLTEDDWKSIESGDDGETLPDRVRRRLTDVVERRFHSFDQQFPPLNETIRAIERDETKEVLERFAAGDLAELAQSGYRPVSFELLLDVTSDEEARIAIGRLDAGIHGRIDRLDRHSDGRIRVIDYKAGKAKRLDRLEARLDEGFRLQLAIYALVVRRLKKLEASSVSASIRPLRIDSSAADRYGFELDAHMERLTEMLGLLGNAMVEGRFPAVPFDDACSYCIIKPWCRVRNDPREAAHATRHGSAVRHLEAGEP